jgi:hypothetical protein
MEVNPDAAYRTVSAAHHRPETFLIFPEVARVP